MQLKIILAFAALALAAPQHRDGRGDNLLAIFPEQLLTILDRDHGRGGRSGVGDVLGGITQGAGDLLGGIANGIDRCLNRPSHCLRH
jgi:hypothetical protein